jgi:hypothetical protein
MSTQVRSAEIVPLRPNSVPAIANLPAAAAEAQPKVFNATFVERLAALNDASRWLRNSGHPPAAVHLQGELPTLHVDGQAARLLITEAKGFNSRRVDDQYRLCSVIVKGCLITWFEPL